jgi:hypothetical protein
VEVLPVLELLLGVLILLGALIFIRRKWPIWFDIFAAKAFASTDVDGSGGLDTSELYTAVLELYLLLNAFGVRVRAPTRQRVTIIMKEVDVDGSGTLDLAEFKRVLRVLTELVAGRMVTQIGLTICAPLAAPIVCRAVGSVSLYLASLLNVSAPAFFSRLPASLPVTITSALLMLTITPALNWVDDLHEHHVHIHEASCEKPVCASRSPAKEKAQ